MRLTHYSDYALRSLMYLAIRADPQRLVNISDIAEAYSISKSHLTKIIHKLGQLGYIETVRGKNGGIRLARLPIDINLGTVIKQIEPDFELVECFAQSVTPDMPTHDAFKIALAQQPPDDQLGCVITPVCQLKIVFAEALTAFINVLEAYTLADIIDNKEALKSILG